MVDLMMSIHHDFAQAIYDGKKKYEFRKNHVTQDVRWVYMYETAPYKQVTGRFSVKNVLTADPNVLYLLCGKYEESHLTRKQFKQYYAGSKTGTALEIDKVEKFDQPKTLANFDIKRAPQNYTTIKVGIN